MDSLSFDSLERRRQQRCVQIWDNTYRTGADDMTVLSHIIAAGQDRSVHGDFMLATTKWIHCGAPQMITDAKYASALMLSAVEDSLVEELEIPWQAFRIELPKDLLTCETTEYRWIYVCSFDLGDGETIGEVLLHGLRPTTSEEQVRGLGTFVESTPYIRAPLASILLDQETDKSFGTARISGVIEGMAASGHDEAALQRCFRLAIRLVVGMLYTMQCTDNFRTKPMSLNDTRKCLRGGPPWHRTIYFGRPMRTDVSKAVAGFLSGKSGRRLPPSVQTLVRGHFKRQVVGVSRVGRKVIWVEPYWRGPEDAPILARPYKIGSER
jgi:hypothetical protein